VEPPKGEITVVLGPSAGGKDVASESDAVAAVGELVEAGLPRRHAADLVSRLTGISRNKLYKASL
jgi:16S rRNA C1402 (ribose-2'-O) methylase RsmI